MSTSSSWLWPSWLWATPFCGSPRQKGGHLMTSLLSFEGPKAFRCTISQDSTHLPDLSNPASLRNVSFTMNCCVSLPAVAQDPCWHYNTICVLSFKLLKIIVFTAVFIYKKKTQKNTTTYTSIESNKICRIIRITAHMLVNFCLVGSVSSWIQQLVFLVTM